MDRKWLIGIVSTLVVLPILVFSRDRICQVWASPTEIKEVKNKVEKQSTALEQIAQLSLEQKSRMDKSEAVSDVQIKALQAQLELVSELKKKR